MTLYSIEAQNAQNMLPVVFVKWMNDPVCGPNQKEVKSTVAEEKGRLKLKGHELFF
jgi:hypothetical protein